MQVSLGVPYGETRKFIVQEEQRDGFDNIWVVTMSAKFVKLL
jgi:hypothetical protein